MKRPSLIASAAGLVILQIGNICFIFAITTYQVNEINFHVSHFMENLKYVLLHIF